MKKTHIIITVLTIALLSACTVTDTKETASNWQIVSGTPPYADPEPIIYEGNVNLTGEIVDESPYGGETSPYFKLNAASRANIPDGIESDTFKLMHASTNEKLSDKEIEKLRTEELTVSASKIKINMEGAPFLYIND